MLLNYLFSYSITESYYLITCLVIISLIVSLNELLGYYGWKPGLSEPFPVFLVSEARPGSVELPNGFHHHHGLESGLADVLALQHVAAVVEVLG